MNLLYSIKSKLRSHIYSCCNLNKLNLHQTTSQLLKYSKKSAHFWHYNSVKSMTFSCLNITVQMVSATVATVLILIIITMTVLMTTTVQCHSPVQHQALAL